MARKTMLTNIFLVYDISIYEMARVTILIIIFSVYDIPIGDNDRWAE
jgi:hypothetical protein